MSPEQYLADIRAVANPFEGTSEQDERNRRAMRLLSEWWNSEEFNRGAEHLKPKEAPAK